MRVIKNNSMVINEIVKFSHYYVAGFLRIESLHSFLNRKRDYEKYTRIPTILVEYLQLKTEEEKISFINDEFNLLSKNLYEDSWNNIIKVGSKKSQIDEKEYENTNNYIDKLNNLLTQKYNITEDNFFSSINIIYKEQNLEVEEDDFTYLLKELKQFFYNFTQVNKEIEKEIKKEIRKSIKNADLRMCLIIISTEFSSFLHHLYVAYHTKNDKKDNIRKSLNHLQRANRDARKAIELYEGPCSHDKIRQRLKEINEVGM